MYKHNIPKNVVVSEYVQASEYFLEKAQISYLNAILDKLSKLIRKVTNCQYVLKIVKFILPFLNFWQISF